jgi:preprotein translocase subunit SecY
MEAKGKFVALIVAIITAVGLIVQAVPANELQGLFANILYGREKWYLNPVVLAILITVLVNFAGYLENASRNPQQPYSAGKFAETYLKYLPMMLVFTQYLPPEQASALSLALDIISRAIKKAGSTKS